MKTWLDRIAAARIRGRFTEADRKAWEGCATCPVGEVTRAVTGVFYDAVFWRALDDMGADLQREWSSYQDPILAALEANDFDRLEDLLADLHEDALILKRGGADRMRVECEGAWSVECEES